MLRDWYLELSLGGKKYSTGEPSRAGMDHMPLRNLGETERGAANGSSKNCVSQISFPKQVMFQIHSSSIPYVQGTVRGPLKGTPV